MALYTQVGLGAGNIVLDGDQASLLRKGQSPHQFSAHVYYIQKAGWIKTLLGTEVNLSPGHIVLGKDQLPRWLLYAFINYSSLLTYLPTQSAMYFTE